VLLIDKQSQRIWNEILTECLKRSLNSLQLPLANIVTLILIIGTGASRPSLLLSGSFSDS